MVLVDNTKVEDGGAFPADWIMYKTEYSIYEFANRMHIEKMKTNFSPTIPVR